MLSPSFVRLFALVALGLPLQAQSVFLVDDDGGPGIDFTDLQVAVWAAGPLDRIDVFPGVYGDVLIHDPVVIMGLAAAPEEVQIGAMRIQTVAAGESAVLSGFQARSILATGNGGTLLLDGLRLRALLVDDCRDVRLQNSSIESHSTYRPPAIDVFDSFVQVTSCQIRGGSSVSGAFWQMAPAAVEVAGVSEVLIASSALQGGEGQSDYNPFTGRIDDYPGGPGIEIVGSSVRVLCLDSTVVGGLGSDDGWKGPGDPGKSIQGCEALSEVTICRSLVPDLSSACDQIHNLDPTYPAVEILPSSPAGSAPTLHVRGGNGEQHRAILGDVATFVGAQSGFVPQLTSANRSALLDPFGGSKAFTAGLDLTGMPRGTIFYLQSAQVQLHGGARWSNAAAVLVH